MNYINQQFVKLLIFIVVLSCSNVIHAHSKGYSTDTAKLKNIQISELEDTILSFAEKMPEFPGGRDSLKNFIVSHFQLPEEAIKNGIFGKVFVQFIVNKQGKVLNPKVLKGIGGGCDEEALRVVQNFPDWTPGQENGKVVSVYYTIPIIFQKPVEEPLTFVEEMPEFPGGMDAMMRFLWGNIRYPKTALELGIRGKIVLQYVIDINGEIRNVKVIRSLGGGCDEEAIRVVKLMPKWKPGRQNGKIVPVYFTLPIFFQLKE